MTDSPRDIAPRWWALPPFVFGVLAALWVVVVLVARLWIWQVFDV